MENEMVRKRISQSSALRQKRKALEPEPVHKLQGPNTELRQKMNGDDPLSPLTEVELIQANGSNGFASSGDYTTENSLRSEEEEIFSPASPLEYSKFESKHSRNNHLELGGRDLRFWFLNQIIIILFKKPIMCWEHFTDLPPEH